MLEAISGGRSDNGRWGAHSWQVRVLAWGQLSRRAPPSAVASNISDTVSMLLPHVKMAMPSKDLLRKFRGELVIAGEIMAAMRFAECRRILSFGFDESSKKQVRLPSRVRSTSHKQSNAHPPAPYPP
jgi:hypothetical protein